MKKDVTLPTKEESARLVAAIRDEDIDLTDMPDRGGATDWKRGEDRVIFKKRRGHSLEPVVFL
jgi:hypothetical protein